MTPRSPAAGRWLGGPNRVPTWSYACVLMVTRGRWTQPPDGVGLAALRRREVEAAGAVLGVASHRFRQAGAKVVALTVIDFLTRPELTTEAWDYFRNVQTKTTKYVPLIRPTDKPAIWLNKERMEKYRPEMKRYYYDPTSTRTISSSSGSNIRQRKSRQGRSRCVRD